MCVGSWQETANLLKGPTMSPCWSARCQAGPRKKHADWLDLGFLPDFNQLQNAIHCPCFFFTNLQYGAVSMSMAGKK